jgi:ABC-2 type transport system permease protein
MQLRLRQVRAIVGRELYGYLGSPVAYVFITAFLLLAGFLAIKVLGFFESNSTSLEPFLFWHPWLFLILVPAIGMRMWAEERRNKTMELLFTMPITQWHAIVGKYIAGSLILALTLAMTFPMVLTVNYLGSPDSGALACGYLASLLVGMAFLAVSSLTSSLTRNQVVSFILSLALCLLLIIIGFPPVTDLFRYGEAIPKLTNLTLAATIVWLVIFLVLAASRSIFAKLLETFSVWGMALVAWVITAGLAWLIMSLTGDKVNAMMGGGTPTWLVDLVSSFSVYPHFERMKIGVIDLRSVLYFASVIVFGLFGTGLVLHRRRDA